MPQHRIYIASSYRNKDRMREVAASLEEIGHKVTSSWIHEEWPHDVQVEDVPKSMRAGYAHKDIYEILDSDVVVHFRNKDEPYFRAGSSVEYGMGIICVVLHSILVATGEVIPKRVMLVGDRINVFDDLPLVGHYPNDEAFLEWARGETRQ